MKLLPTMVKSITHPIETAKNIKGFFVIDDLDGQIVKLNQAKQAATKYWDAINVEGKSKELAAQADGMDRLDKETKELIVTSRNRAHAEEVLTNAIQTQTKAQKLLNSVRKVGASIFTTLASTALSIGISFVISKIISSISDLVNAEKKEKELAKERAEEAKQQLETQKQYVKDISSIAKEYEELGKVTNKTEEQKQALVDLQNQLVETFCKEAKGIDLVNGKYEEQIELLKQKTEEQYKQQYYDALEPYQNSKDNFENNKDNIFNVLTDPNEYQATTISSATNGLSELLDIAKKYNEGNYGRYTEDDIFTGNRSAQRAFIDFIRELNNSGEDVYGDEYRQKLDDMYRRYLYAYRIYNKNSNATYGFEELDLFEKILSIDGISVNTDGNLLLSGDLNANKKVDALYKVLDILEKDTSKEFKASEGYLPLISRINNLIKDYQVQASDFKKNEETLIEGWLGSFTSSRGTTFENLLSMDTSTLEGWHLFSEEFNNFIDEVSQNYAGDTEELIKFLRENLYYIKQTIWYSATFPTEKYIESISDIFDEYSDDIENLKTKVSEFDGWLEKIRSGSLTSEEEIEILKLHPELVGVDDLYGAIKDLKDNAVSELVDEMSQIKVPEHLKDELDYIIQKFKDLSKLSLSDFIDLVEKQYDKEINKANDQISNLEKLRDKETSYYDEKISKLQEANEEQEKANELEEAYQELERARTQKTLKVWRSGVGWTWETDKNAIKEAQSTVSSLEQEKEISNLEKSKEAITSKYDAQIESLNDYIDTLEEYKSSYQDYVDDMSDEYDQEYLDSKQLTLNLKGDFDQREADLKTHKENVLKILSEDYGIGNLETGKSVADNILNQTGNKSWLDVINQNPKNKTVNTPTWSWYISPEDAKLTKQATNSSLNNIIQNTFTFGNIVANNPVEFGIAMSKYLKENKTKSIIK